MNFYAPTGIDSYLYNHHFHADCAGEDLWLRCSIESNSNRNTTTTPCFILNQYLIINTNYISHFCLRETIRWKLSQESKLLCCVMKRPSQNPSVPSKISLAKTSICWNAHIHCVCASLGCLLKLPGSLCPPPPVLPFSSRLVY